MKNGGVSRPNIGTLVGTFSNHSFFAIHSFIHSFIHSIFMVPSSRRRRSTERKEGAYSNTPHVQIHICSCGFFGYNYEEITPTSDSRFLRSYRLTKDLSSFLSALFSFLDFYITSVSSSVGVWGIASSTIWQTIKSFKSKGA